MCTVCVCVSVCVCGVCVRVCVCVCVCVWFVCAVRTRMCAFAGGLLCSVYNMLAPCNSATTSNVLSHKIRKSKLQYSRYQRKRKSKQRPPLKWVKTIIALELVCMQTLIAITTAVNNSYTLENCIIKNYIFC